MIREEGAIDFQVPHVPANYLTRLLRAQPRRELAKVKGLRSRHEFDAKNAAGVIHDLGVLQRGIHAHRDEVFLVGGRGDGLHGGRGGEHALLDDEVIGRVLAEHETGIEARFMGQEVGESLRERRIGEAI